MEGDSHSISSVGVLQLSAHFPEFNVLPVSVDSFLSAIEIGWLLNGMLSERVSRLWRDTNL